MKHFLVTITILLNIANAHSHESHHGHILSPESKDVIPAFDIVHAKVTTQGDFLVFQQEVSSNAGINIPSAIGSLANAEVYSYVWPTSLNSSAVGFEADQGILALALTIHPDFDDTPLYDEDGDGDNSNDGNKWHSHWVVLVKDASCGEVGMKVKDIPPGITPKLPQTWPNLPIFIDSPGYDFDLVNNEIKVQVPLEDVGFPSTFSFDAVTSALKVNAQVHSPLLCITDVWDIASGDLSLPGQSK